MPTVDENIKQWANYDWQSEGHEWNLGYGGTHVAWDMVVEPRIRAFLPAKHVLEIAPGFGVWTARLKPLAKRMTLVDLTPRCIEHCRNKFGSSNMNYIVNDGRSLAGVPDDSVDFVFSWHSLVHVEHDVMRDYINQLAKKMAKGGAGIIHHSNFGAYIDPSTGEANLPNTHWRGVTMTAERFRQDCVASGLHCTGQELVPWGYPHLTDCFSVFRRPHKPGEPVQTTVVENPEFWDFIRNQAKVIPVYRPAGVDGYPKHESSRWIDMLRGALRRAWT